VQVIAFLLGILLSFPALATPVCTYVSPSSTQQITGPDGVCKKITNNNGSAPLCATTYSIGEWQGFYNNSQRSYTIATCQCSAGTAAWLTNCSAPVGVLNYGASTGVTNTAGGYTGSVTVTCNAGSYSYSSTSCSGVSNLPGGSGCSNNSQCMSNTCYSGTCYDNGTEYTECTYDWQCSPNYGCDYGQWPPICMYRGW
jgi:hypothetical protein